ncbi:SIS domain-containing protein [Erysipelothrix urinaevulpis]|uniref:SIS domain-containing protein n=1 Tax=Erysipelothrix urinaevulpis TaxID=2683717 RepID=UPI001915BAA1|nr:SIS domain-containing protein [Erysipelothrix urinaevulpis]
MMDLNSVVEKVLEKSDTRLETIYLVACGGSLVDMYTSDYFINTEAKELVAGLYTANEFNHVVPKKLNENSLVIICSHGGNTPESVEAANVARRHNAQSIGLTYNEESMLFETVDHKILYEWGEDTSVENNPMAIILNIVVEILHRQEGYAHYEAFKQGMHQIDDIVKNAQDQIQERTDQFADTYGKEEMFYILGSGASYGHAYGFSICSLMEMQWLHASAIHSGEYFHGPFEATDHSTPYILLMSEGPSRPLDERVLKFFKTYAKKYEVVDAKELGLSIIDENVSDYFNPILFYSVLSVYRYKLSIVRNHPLDTRRYMGKVEY